MSEKSPALEEFFFKTYIQTREFFRLDYLEKRVFKRFPKMSETEKERIKFLIEVLIKEIFGNWQRENTEKQKGK